MNAYCKYCQQVTPHRQKGTRHIEQVCDECDSSMKNPVSLIRERDGKMIPGTQVEFVEWNESGKFKQLHDEPAVGFSCMIDPQYIAYGWLTTEITEITSDTTEDTVRCIHFKTKNSNYKLYIVNQ